MAEDATLERVRKLLAKAERAGTPEEAETYTSKAAELMARHGIDRALVDAGRDERERETVTSRKIRVVAPYAIDKSRLVFGLADAMGCQAIRHSTGSRSEYRMTIFGFPSDLERLDVLFTSLLLQAERLVRRERAPAWESTAAFRRTWLEGFTDTVTVRVCRAERDALRDVQAERGETAGSGAGAELVLADRGKAVGRAVKETFPRARAEKRAPLSGSGYGAGMAAGERADVGARRVGQDSRRALR